MLTENIVGNRPLAQSGRKLTKGMTMMTTDWFVNEIKIGLDRGYPEGGSSHKTETLQQKQISVKIKRTRILGGCQFHHNVILRTCGIKCMSYNSNSKGSVAY